METEKTCKNCKYYNKQYSIFKGRLLEVGGLCIHDKIFPKNVNNKFIPRKDCKYWEDREDIIIDRRERVINEIQKMKTKLDDIALILNAEK